MKRLFLAALFVVAMGSAFALPTVEQVQAELAAGRTAQAEQMMREVIAARPGSAKAHYVYAEILAHDRHFEQAAEQAAQARAIDPALKFTDPAKFIAFEQLLGRELAGRQRAGASTQPAAVAAPPLRAVDPGVPGWVWALGGAGLALLAWRLFASRRPASASALPAAPGATAAAGMPGYASGYAPGAVQPATGMTGGSLLGTGLAVAGGVAAGMMAEKWLDGRHDPAAGMSGAQGAGYVPGLFDGPAGDDAAARVLEQRKIDFGTGDGWGGGDDAGAAGGDSGGGGDDGGGW